MKWLLILCGLIACAGNAVCNDCAATLSPSRVVVKYGDSFSANCSSTPSVTQGMGWESTQDGVPLTDGASFVPLTVKSVTDWMITPVCFFNLHNGTQCPHKLPVTVYKMPDNVRMTTHFLHDLVEGTQYKFDCDVKNVAPVMNLTVRWLIRDQLKHRSDYGDETRTPVDKSVTYEYTASGDDDGAEILCEAKLSFDSPNVPAKQSDSQKLVIQYPPKFNSPANVTLNDTERSNKTLSCTARGNPTPTYTWKLPEAVQEKLKNHKDAELTVPWDLQFAGTYACTASNNRGSSTKYFNVVQVPRDRTTMAIILGVGLFAAAVLIVIGAIYVKSDGAFSCNKGSYTRGQPSSGPV